jgi:hypothetical protein
MCIISRLLGDSTADLLSQAEMGKNRFEPFLREVGFFPLLLRVRSIFSPARFF